MTRAGRDLASVVVGVRLRVDGLISSHIGVHPAVSAQKGNGMTDGNDEKKGTLVRGPDGTVYLIPEDDLKRYQVSPNHAEELKGRSALDGMTRLGLVLLAILASGAAAETATADVSDRAISSIMLERFEHDPNFRRSFVNDPLGTLRESGVDVDELVDNLSTRSRLLAEYREYYNRGTTPQAPTSPHPQVIQPPVRTPSPLDSIPRMVVDPRGVGMRPREDVGPRAVEMRPREDVGGRAVTPSPGGTTKK